jgi:hypothetical protein
MLSYLLQIPRLLTALFSVRVSLVTRKPVSTKSFSTPFSYYAINQLGLLFVFIYLFSFSWALFPSWHCRYFIFYLFIGISLYSFCLFVFFHHYDLHAVPFLGTFAKAQQATLSFVMPVCSSVRPNGKTPLPLDGFSWNSICTHFSKVYRDNSRFLKICQG